MLICRKSKRGNAYILKSGFFTENIKQSEQSTKDKIRIDLLIPLILALCLLLSLGVFIYVYRLLKKRGSFNGVGKAMELGKCLLFYVNFKNSEVTGGCQDVK